MTGFSYTPEARLHLLEIWDYSAQRWSERQADRYLAAIEASIALVAEGKLRARPCLDLLPGLHFVRSGSHNVYLRWDHEADMVRILGVLHQRMEPSRHLRDEQ
jgi:toxin ParE1/3/4